MNEQRLEVYIHLIQDLLSCPSGEEKQILQAHVELIDDGLIQTMEQVAEVLEEREEGNGAEFLKDLTHQLASLSVGGSRTSQGQVDSTLTPQELQARLDLLMQVLQAIAESDGDAQVVYGLLQANLDKLDYVFAQLMRRWAEQTLPDLEPEQARSLAADLNNFSSLMGEFSSGSPMSNWEIAMTGYEIVLNVFTRDTSPEVWATTQNNLGVAYMNRMGGNRADNRERAIAAYSAALQV